MSSTGGIGGGGGNIVLIHGLWMTPLSWEGWVERFEARGYTVLTPGWPTLDRPIEEVRANPGDLGKVGIAEIVDHYAAVIGELPEPPIIMGHSFGGLTTQLLVNRGLGRAAVSIATAPPKGVLALPFSSLKVASYLTANPLNNGKAKALTPKQFRYAFGNTLDEAGSLAVYEKYAIPGPARPLFQAALANLNPKSPAKIDYANADRPPMLLVCGEQDHISPPSISRSLMKLYRKSPVATEYKEYAGRSHWLCGEPGWEEIADHALEWAEAHPREPTA